MLMTCYDPRLDAATGGGAEDKKPIVRLGHICSSILVILVFFFKDFCGFKEVFLGQLKRE